MGDGNVRRAVSPSVKIGDLPYTQKKEPFIQNKSSRNRACHILVLIKNDLIKVPAKFFESKSRTDNRLMKRCFIMLLLLVITLALSMINESKKTNVPENTLVSIEIVSESVIGLE